MSGIVGHERTCPMCGKNFINPVSNIYKLRIKDKIVKYCSYTCYRKAQKEIK